MHCPECGTFNPNSANYCNTCGRSLDETQTTHVHFYEARQPSVSAFQVIMIILITLICIFGLSMYQSYR